MPQTVAIPTTNYVPAWAGYYPVHATENGESGFAVMSIETYKTLSGKNELYQFIQDGIDDIENGRTLTEEEIIKNMDNALTNEYI